MPIGLRCSKERTVTNWIAALSCLLLSLASIAGSSQVSVSEKCYFGCSCSVSWSLDSPPANPLKVLLLNATKVVQVVREGFYDQSRNITVVPDWSDLIGYPLQLYVGSDENPFDVVISEDLFSNVFSLEYSYLLIDTFSRIDTGNVEETRGLLSVSGCGSTNVTIYGPQITSGSDWMGHEVDTFLYPVTESTDHFFDLVAYADLYGSGTYTIYAYLIEAPDYVNIKSIYVRGNNNTIVTATPSESPSLVDPSPTPLPDFPSPTSISTETFPPIQTPLPTGGSSSQTPSPTRYASHASYTPAPSHSNRNYTSGNTTSAFWHKAADMASSAAVVCVGVCVGVSAMATATTVASSSAAAMSAAVSGTSTVSACVSQPLAALSTVSAHVSSSSSISIALAPASTTAQTSAAACSAVAGSTAAQPAAGAASISATQAAQSAVTSNLLGLLNNLQFISQTEFLLVRFPEAYHILPNAFAWTLLRPQGLPTSDVTSFTSADANNILQQTIFWGVIILAVVIGLHALIWIIWYFWFRPHASLRGFVAWPKYELGYLCIAYSGLCMSASIGFYKGTEKWAIVGGLLLFGFGVFFVPLVSVIVYMVIKRLQSVRFVPNEKCLSVSSSTAGLFRKLSSIRQEFSFSRSVSKSSERTASGSTVVRKIESSRSGSPKEFVVTVSPTTGSFTSNGGVLTNRASTPTNQSFTTVKVIDDNNDNENENEEDDYENLSFASTTSISSATVLPRGDSQDALKGLTKNNKNNSSTHDLKAKKGSLKRVLSYFGYPFQTLFELQSRMIAGTWTAFDDSKTQHLESYGVLFDNFEIKHHAYLAIIFELSKKFMLALLIGSFLSSGSSGAATLQLCILIVIWLAHFVYLLVICPYRDKIENAVQTITCGLEMLIFCLAIAVANGNTSDGLVECMNAVNICTIVLLIVEQIRVGILLLQVLVLSIAVRQKEFRQWFVSSATTLYW
eukprot:CAMPEP_0184675262 /NCGR_PEP_ID=MMETSP0308-20130426/87693_1 /TAXON_ID=38269 /ORGANISM="Gloeochaete witrockiana, Strain SAG 46.84" /LENGTH=961 /DNA_ID=CAMNT_0027122951 /DNA_START=267 /DNA_END=3149 /DNA_ORIENTATION=+